MPETLAEDIHAYLQRNQRKELLRFLTCGSVDDGKSTLIGRLLYDSKSVFQDQLESVERTSADRGDDKVSDAAMEDRKREGYF
jgi:bifunctional enzyme CysN/CysC